MRIEQCKMLNNDMYSRFSYFFKKYSLKKYYNPSKPSIFFSLWGYGAIKNHKSFAVIIWRGTDVVKLQGALNRIRKNKNIYHVAISSYIKKDLDRFNIKSKFIPIVGVDVSFFKPCEMGDEIYTYVPSHRTDKYYKRYGMEIIKKIQKKIKYKINIIDSCNKYPRKKLLEIYKRCFCSLRMTKHDGLPSQVIEMGLMGRRSIYNGSIPGSIKWNKKDINNIIDNIEKEAKKIGTIDYQYSEEIGNFIDIENKWLDTKFWEWN
jgi:hypothetical protein